LQNDRIFGFSTLFSNGKIVDSVHDRGPRLAPVHGGLAVDGGTKLTGAWPLAAPVLKGTSKGAGEGEWETGNPTVRSPELRRQ
jgi:hypothetical protein